MGYWSVIRFGVDDEGTIDGVFSFSLAASQSLPKLIGRPLIGAPYVRPMGNLVAVGGRRLELPCPVAGYPIDSITWEKGQLPFFFIPYVSTLTTTATVVKENTHSTVSIWEEIDIGNPFQKKEKKKNRKPIDQKLATQCRCSRRWQRNAIWCLTTIVWTDWFRCQTDAVCRWTRASGYNSTGASLSIRWTRAAIRVSTRARLAVKTTWQPGNRLISTSSVSPSLLHSRHIFHPQISFLDNQRANQRANHRNQMEITIRLSLESFLSVVQYFLFKSLQPTSIKDVFTVGCLKK